MNLLAFTRLNRLPFDCEEALNTLCVNLALAGPEYVKIMVTSSHASEGKSFIAMNMLRKLSALGGRVVLVDADLRRSSLSFQYGMRSRSAQPPGLSHYLAGECDMEDILHATNIEGAYIIPTRHEADALPLLNTPRFPRLLNRLSELFDVVLVDTPPVGVLSDAVETARFCDGALMVVSYNQVSRRELSGSVSQIERAGCRVLGVVINKATIGSLGGRKDN